MSDILDAITKACEREMPPSDPGASIADLMAHWGCSEQETRKRVKLGLERKLLVIGKRWRIDAAKRCVSEQVYRPA